MSSDSTVDSTGWLVYLTVGVILGSLAYLACVRHGRVDPDSSVVVWTVALTAFAVLWLPIVLFGAADAARRRIR